MKISVIITVYNLESYVRQAIESVLQQTRKADEIIVVDDGSTDASIQAIEYFGDKVKLIQMKKNSGVLVAFLAGINAASGDILSFLDGDDVWLPEKLAKVEQAFKNRDDVMMVTHLHEWINGSGKRTDNVDETHKNLNRIKQAAKNEIELDALLKNSALCYKGVWFGSAFCIRRSSLDLPAYETWVLSIPGKELSHQDQPLAAFLIYANPDKRIHLIDETLFQYRVYPTNSSGASGNVEAAIKTIDRSIATVIRTKNIVEKNRAWREENFSQKMKLKELEFYRDLYTGNRLAALKKYVVLAASYWDGSKKVKETKRLVACMVLGPKRFLEVKTKLRFN